MEKEKGKRKKEERNEKNHVAKQATTKTWICTENNESQGDGIQVNRFLP